MDYIEITVPCMDLEQAEITMALLSDLPFESFETGDTFLKAFIPACRMEESREEIEAVLRSTGMRCAMQTIGDRNWNAEWESSFEPVVAGNISIRAPFHDPPAEGMLDIVIMPKMSFGTGHHATTRLMATLMSGTDLTGRRILDMGSGTGILAIIAAKMGSGPVDAVDIDEWAFNNCAENIRDNGVEDLITPILGDVTVVEGRKYETILANINRNILCRDMGAYSRLLVPGGNIIISGILDTDLSDIDGCASVAGLQRIASASEEGWTGAVYVNTI